MRDPLDPLRAAMALADFLAPDYDAALKSAVRAVLPGRQQKKNLAPALQSARRAFARTLRRRATNNPPEGGQ